MGLGQLLPRSLQPSRLDVASRAAMLAIAANAMLMVLKISVGLIFGSVAVLGDGIDSAEDVLASGLAFFTIRLALQPADQAHPYGHGKAESLAALSQAALIGGGAVFIAIAAARQFGSDADIEVGPSVVTMAITIAVNLGVAAYAMRAARISGSVAIAADARHLVTNVVQAAAVIAALVLVGVTGSDIFDPIVALLLAAYLAWMALNILRVALSELIDSALPEHEVAQLEACLAHEEHGVRGFHELRTRKSGRQKYIDLHILVDPALTVSEAHTRVEDIERDVTRIIPGALVSIHVDPDEPGIMERSQPSEPVEAPGSLHLHRH
jgi:cation diffusion facilitator family transporter